MGRLGIRLSQKRPLLAKKMKGGESDDVTYGCGALIGYINESANSFD
jgi:hypothetical protein